ncbi:MAG: response regulator [Syntrophobacter sp.]
MSASRILIVEDEVIVSKEIVQRLRAMGYEPAGRASSGEQALALTKAQRPDLVLMDIRLKGVMDGITAAEEIRRDFRIPVVFLTAYSEDDTLERAKLAEPYGYLIKPFDDRELKSAIEIALYKHKTEEEIRRLNRLYDVLSQVNQTIVRVESREELLSAVCRLVVERGLMDLAWIGRLDPITLQIEPVAQFGEANELLNVAKPYAGSQPGEENAPANPILDGEPFICNECEKSNFPDTFWNAAAESGFKSCGSFPLMFQGSVWGTLNVCVSERGVFRKREIGLLKEVALDISFALDKIEGNTQREQAQAALQESELRWQFALEGAGDGLWDWNPRTGDVFFSRQWKAMLGYKEHEIANTLDKWNKHLHPEDRERVLADIARHLDGHTPSYINEHRILCADGSYKWILGRGKVISRTEDGKPLRVIGTHSDISERKRAEEALHESEKRLRRAEQVAHFGHWELMLDTGELRVSDGARIIFGLANNHCSLADVRDIPLLKYRPLLDRALRELLEEGKPYNIEYKIRRPTDGQILHIHSIAEYAPEKPVIFGVIHDITERKLSEEEIRTQRETLARVFDSAPSIMMIVDRELRVTTINHIGIAFSGRPKESLPGMVAGEVFNCIHSFGGRKCGKNPYCSICPVGSRIMHTFQTGESIYQAEGSITVRGDSGDYPLHMLISTTLLKDKTSDTVLVSIMDNTERKKMEEERSNAEAQIRQAQKMEAIGLLAGGIAHDFNNILSAIIGYSEMALDAVPDKSSLQKDLHQVLNAGHRAKELVKQILTFSRQTQREPRPVEISYIVKEALKMLRATLPATIAITQKALVSPRVRVMADPTEIHQVVMNLCTNAAHAMREKGGMLKVELHEVSFGPEEPLPHPDLKHGEYIRLRVSDTGHGMSEEVSAKIFDPFFTTKPKGEGTGMGLSVVHGIVKSCNGAVTVESRPGEGSTFVAYVPGVLPEDLEEDQESRDMPTGRGRVLFVDDEEALVELGKKMLERLGYSVTTKTSSREALEAVKSMPYWFDLLITDYTMPKMTGLNLAREVKHIRPGMPVIVCSGHNEVLNEKTALSFDIEGFVPKPFDRRELSKVINEVLRGGC